MVIGQDDTMRRQAEEALKDVNDQIREINIKENNFINEMDIKRANLYKIKENLESCLDM